MSNYRIIWNNKEVGKLINPISDMGYLEENDLFRLHQHTFNLLYSLFNISRHTVQHFI
jgi:hypothetical protein